MYRKIDQFLIVSLLIFVCLPAPLLAGQMAFLLIDSESYLVNKAISKLEPSPVIDIVVK